jgi:hypothetical protein
MIETKSTLPTHDILPRRPRHNELTHMRQQPDPRSLSNFDLLIGPERFSELDIGHTCVDIPNPPSSIQSGANATLQMMYIADFDSPQNQTFYACADITYVRREAFTTRIPCFNATEDDGGAVHTPTPTPTPSPSGSGLSGGAIAGIVVGVVIGVAIFAAAAFWMYRERKQKNRLLRQQATARGVKWSEEQPPKDSASQGSIRMQNL